MAAAAAATAEDEAEATAELVGVDVVVGAVLNPVPPDADVVVRARSIEDADLGKIDDDLVAVVITVWVRNAALDAVGKIDLESEL